VVIGGLVCEVGGGWVAKQGLWLKGGTGGLDDSSCYDCIMHFGHFY